MNGEHEIGVARHLLDDREATARLDPGGMLGLVSRLGNQFAEALGAEFPSRLPCGPPLRLLVVAGMGGSAIAGEILRGYLEDRSSSPILVHRDGGLPGPAGPGSVLAVVSYSGNTAEALSAYQEGRRRRLPCLALSSGGRLREWARKDGVPWLELPAGYPPRSAVAFSFVPLLRLAAHLNMVDSQEAHDELAEVPAVLSETAGLFGGERPWQENRAKALALSLWNRWPLIHWAEGYLRGVAGRFCTQLAENAKTWAFHSAYPENAHNEIVAWDAPREVTSRLTVVELSGGEEHPAMREQRSLVAELARRRGALVEEVEARGRARLARLFSLVGLGDFTSVYLAFLYGRDPTTIGPIEWLKAQVRGEAG